MTKVDTISEALELRFDSDAGEDITVREWLKSLLMQVWVQGEGFSGKRPWGNSSWEYDLFVALISAGFIEGLVDDEGYILRMDERVAAQFVCRLIGAL